MTSVQQQLEIIKRGSDELLVEAELKDRLQTGRPLRVKAGFDPTAAEFDLMIFGIPGEPGISGVYWTYDFWNPQSPFNLSSWGSEATEKSERLALILAEMPMVADDAAGLTALIQEAEQLLADELVFIPLSGYPTLWAYRPDTVAGFNPIFGADNAAYWYRADL